jgi:hypothetical protein
VSFDATETRRAGSADGYCKRVGCIRAVPEDAANKFYCSDVCGRLANPENPVYAAMRQGDLEFATHLGCSRCGGMGWVRTPCPGPKEVGR